MDYEKKYNEVLKKAKQVYNTPYTAHWDVMKDLIEHLFPELAESEDERIRKELVEFITAIKDISESGRQVWAIRTSDAEMCKRFLAYLEKQKEQKPLEWSEEDERMRQDVIRFIETGWTDNGI